METKTLSVDVYRDKNGNPTCCEDWIDGKVCMFLLTTRYGSSAICALSGEPLERKPFGTAKGDFDPMNEYLRPTCECPLWSEQ